MSRKDCSGFEKKNHDKNKEKIFHVVFTALYACSTLLFPDCDSRAFKMNNFNIIIKSIC